MNAKKSLITKKKKIKLSVYWPDDWKSIVITQKEYQSILDGKSFSTDGDGFRYEGESFYDWWTFEGGANSNLIVTYGDDGAVGFDGSISDCEIEEV